MPAKRRSKCPYCSKLFHPNPRTAARQFTCGGFDCQKQRKADWQRAKRKSDPDYRLNDTVRGDEEKAKKATDMRAYRKKKSASKAAEDPQETGNEAAADLVIEMTPTSCSLEPVLSKQLRVVTEMGKCENDDGTTRLLQLKARLISNRKPNSEEEKAAMRLLAHCDIQIQLRVHDPSSMRTLGLTVTEDTISV